MFRRLTGVLYVLAVAVFAVPAFDPYDFEYRTGQVLITSETEYDASTLFFELATGSRFGHVGVVVIRPDGELRVYESNPGIEEDGAQYTTVQEFVERSNYKGNYQAIVMAPKQLSKQQQQQLSRELDKMVAEKIPYNYNQVYVESQQARNCSEFVYSAYKRIGVEGIGYKMKLTDLHKESLSGQLIDFWGDELKDHYEFIPPLSIVASSKVKVLASNIPHDRILSDHEILSAWDETSGLTDFVRYTLGYWWFWQIKPAKRELFKAAHRGPYTTFEAVVKVQDR